MCARGPRVVEGAVDMVQMYLVYPKKSEGRCFLFFCTRAGRAAADESSCLRLLIDCSGLYYYY